MGQRLGLLVIGIAVVVFVRKNVGEPPRRRVGRLCGVFWHEPLRCLAQLGAERVHVQARQRSGGGAVERCIDPRPAGDDHVVVDHDGAVS